MSGAIGQAENGSRGRRAHGVLRTMPEGPAVELGGYGWRLTVDTVAALATVLEVTPQAIDKATGAGRIGRDAAGRWEVFAALDAWCKNTRPPRGAAEAQVAPWWIEYGLRWLARPATDAAGDLADWYEEQRRRDAVVGFIRRTRHAGGHVYAGPPGASDGEGWHEVPDPVALLGSAEEVEGAALEELGALVPDAGARLDFARLVVPELAGRVGVAPEVLGPHLARVVRDWIAEDGACQDDTQRWGPPAYPYPIDTDAAYQARMAVPTYAPALRPPQRGLASTPDGDGAPDAAQGEAHA